MRIRRRKRTLSDLIRANIDRIPPDDRTPPVDLLQILMGERD